ncbi:MAG: hypothetical protein AABX93_02090 [Nanoarchaeota archaeon]
MADADFLLQMTKSLDELETKLENYYKAGDIENLNKTKKIMIEIQKKISEAIDAI